MLLAQPPSHPDMRGPHASSVSCIHHFLLVFPLQNETYTLQQLLAASPIQTDLGALVSAGAGENISLPAFVNNTGGTVSHSCPPASI